MPDIAISPVTPVTNGGIVTASNPLPVMVVSGGGGASITTNTTLSVPSQYATIALAMASLANSSIAAGVFVTIQVADGQIAAGSTSTNLGHPFASRIKVLGDTSAGATFNGTITGNTTLTVNSVSVGNGNIVVGRVITGAGITAGTRITALGSGTGGTGTYTITSSANVAASTMKAGPKVIITSTAPDSTTPLFYISDGSALGLFDGFALVGPGRAVNQLSGVAVYNGSSLTGGAHVSSQDFYFPVYCANRSWVQCDSWVLSGGGDGNLFVYNGAAASFSAGESFGGGGVFASAGMVIEHGSAVFAPNCNLHHNAGSGAFFSNVSTGNLGGSTITNNTNFGVRMIGLCTIDSSSLTMSSNGADISREGISMTYTGYVATAGDVVLDAATGTRLIKSTNTSSTGFSEVRFLNDTTGDFRFGLAGSAAPALGVTAPAYLATVTAVPIVIATLNLMRSYYDGTTGSHVRVSGTDQYIAAGGTADVMTATYVPAIAGLLAGQRFLVKAVGTNTVTTPTLNVNGLGAKTIVKRAATALAAGDYVSGQMCEFIYDGTNMQLLNPVVN